MISPVNNNQYSNTGLKIGTGATAVAAVSVLNTSKIIDFTTAKTAKNTRIVAAAQNNIIEQTKNYMKKITSEDLTKLGEQIINDAQKLKTDVYKNASNMFNLRKDFKKINKFKLIAIATPIYIGCGAIVDYMNNRQKAKSEPNAKTKNGNDYVKVNMGKKLGIGLGLLAEAGIVGLNMLAKNYKKGNATTSAYALTAVGGFLLGALADKQTNMASRKQADNNA